MRVSSYLLYLSDYHWKNTDSDWNGTFNTGQGVVNNSGSLYPINYAGIFGGIVVVSGITHYAQHTGSR